MQGILCARLLFHIHAINEFPEGTYISQIDSSRTFFAMAPHISAGDDEVELRDVVGEVHSQSA